MKLFLTANPKAKGDGTAAGRPLFAGGGRIDQILGNLWRSGAEGVEVRLGPGVYDTLGNANYVGGLREPAGGWQGWRCRSDWRMYGAGPSSTTLRITRTWPHHSEPERNGCAGIATTCSDVQNVHVEGLTVDCRGNEIGDDGSNIAGVSLLGSGHTIRRVHVMRSCGRSRTPAIHENFPIHIGCHSRTSTGNLIEHCEVSEFAGGTGGKITMSNNNNNGREPITWTSGIVRNCKVTGSQIGYGGWGMRGVRFEQCVSHRCAYGFNVDSWRNEGLQVIGCKFLTCGQYGMVIAAGAGWKIEGNTIQAQQPILLIGRVGWLTINRNKIIGLPIAWRNPEQALGPIMTDISVLSQLPAHLVIPQR